MALPLRQRDWPDDDGLDNTMLTDRGRQLLQGLLIEDRARLAPVRHDLRDIERDHLLPRYLLAPQCRRHKRRSGSVRGSMRLGSVQGSAVGERDTFWRHHSTF